MSHSNNEVSFDPSQIDAIFSCFDQCRLPGAAVGIAIAGRPVYRRGFGLASMELPLVLSPSMRMRIGSTTKHFTALAYLLLCEDGKAGIDDPIGKYLPELHPHSRIATMRQLMSNVGGLRDACDIVLRFSGAGRPVSTSEILSLYERIDDVNAAAGSAWIYNNAGYVMLSIAIERIAGQPLEEVLRERIFQPAGMNDTLLRRFDTDFVPNSATLHMTTPQGVYQKSYFGLDFAGAGAMVSTVDDMLRWLSHMERPTVGTSSTWSSMKTAYTLKNGKSTGYALGLMLSSYRGMETLSHPGGGMGGNAQMIKVPAAGLDIVVIVNRHDAQSMQLAAQVMVACLPTLSATPISPAPREVTASRETPATHGAPTPATGTFRSPTSGRVIQLLATEGEQIVSLDGFDLNYTQEPGGILRPVPIWSFMKRTVRLLAGTPDAIRLDDFGNEDDFHRVAPAVPTQAQAAAGRYRSDMTGSEALIESTDDTLHLHTTGRFGSAPYVLEPIGASIWRARPGSPMNLGGVVYLHGDAAGFDFVSYGNRALPFRRCS